MESLLVPIYIDLYLSEARSYFQIQNMLDSSEGSCCICNPISSDAALVVNSGLVLFPNIYWDSQRITLPRIWK